MRLRLLVWIALAVLGASRPAGAVPSHGAAIDRACTANGWIPPRPFNPNNSTVINPVLTNCRLCHVRSARPDSLLTPAGEQFRASGYTDVSPFCRPVPLNGVPIFDAVAPLSVQVGANLQFVVIARDPEGDALALSVSGAPAGAVFKDAGDGSGELSWTPSLGQVGNHVVTFHATDAGVPMASGTLEVAIAVGAVPNRPPLLDAIGDQAVAAGQTLALVFAASDPDGDAIAFDVSPNLPGATLVGASFAWTPPPGQAGNHTVTVTATDAGTPPLADSETFVITVGAVNRPPQLGPIGDRSVLVGATLRIPLIARDPDGDALRLACSGLPPDASFTDLLDGTGEIVWTPSARGESVAVCTATDDGVPPESAQESFRMSALAPPTQGGAAPRIDDARWDASARRLFVRATLAARPDDDDEEDEDHERAALVDVFARLADGSDVLLGSRWLGDRERRAVAFELAPFLAPCQIVLASDGALSAPLAVTSAAARCDEQLLLEVRDARARCEEHELRLRAHRAPPGGSVSGSDAASEEPLFDAAVRRSTLKLRTQVATLPRALTLSASSGDHTWTLDAPVPVRLDPCDDDD